MNDNDAGVETRGRFIIDPDGIVQGFEVLSPPVGRNILESLREIQAFQLVRESKGTQVTPSGWRSGKMMSSKSSSTIGFEKINNPVLNLTAETFEKQMKQSFPERPKSFSHIIQTNKNGVPLLDRCPITRDMSPWQVKDQIDSGALVLDTRDTAAFGGVHIPGSINIGFEKQTANWIGMVIDPGAELILIVTDEEAYASMTVHLHRIGYDNSVGYLYGGMAAWQEAGYPIHHLWQISTEKLRNKIETGKYDFLYDVRTLSEWSSGHIRQATHLPLTALLKTAPEISKEREIIVTCGIGYRGNIAASFLQSQVFQHVHSLAGGMKAWINSGQPISTHNITKLAT